MTIQPVSMEKTAPSARWAVLLLAAMTNALAVAAPSMAMPVLFDEISTELQLSLVEVGVIWGIGALPGILSGLFGGAVGDRVGSKRVLFFAVLAAGLFGALRGLALNFVTLAAGMFLLGLVTPMIPMNSLKTCSQWFPQRQLGLASGVLSMGMAAGFLVGSMFSATTFSPWLGGWRPVLFAYGAAAALLAVPWHFLRAVTDPYARIVPRAEQGTFFANIFRIVRIRNVWLFGLALFGISGCVQGTLGYLPLHLRGLGWEPASADAALAVFHTVSLVFVVPIALLSDRLGRRKVVLLSAAGMTITGVALLAFVDGPLVWLAVLTAGLVRDGFMAVYLTSIVETKGVGSAFTGTAIGVVMLFSGISNLLAPPVGNSMAAFGSGFPFLFWAGLSLFGLLSLVFTTENGKEPAA